MTDNELIQFYSKFEAKERLIEELKEFLDSRQVFLNDKNNIYMCVCCQNTIKWLVGKIDAKSIIKVLKNEITILELLLHNSTKYISIAYINGKYNIKYDNSDWKGNSKYLPKKDSYIYSDEDEFDEEIKYFLNLDKSLIIEVKHL